MENQFLMSTSVTQRLQALRDEIQFLGLNAWLVTSADPHLSEHLPEHWMFLRYLSGFTGSYGCMVITADRALLWTDSRYWEQAARQLEGSGIELMRFGAEGVPNARQWLCENLPENAQVGCDPLTISENDFRRFEIAFSERGMILTGYISVTDHVWKGRPHPDVAPISVFTNAQESVARKLEKVRKAVHAAGADSLLLGTLEDIAWLTNLRGSDIACTPVFTSYLLVTDEDVTLYVDPTKIQTADVKKHLKTNGISVVAYSDRRAHIAQHLNGHRVLLDADAVNHAVYALLEQESSAYVVAGERPTALLKSRKNKAELELLKETMRQDGAALCEFFARLDEMLWDGETPTEQELAEMLHAERAKRKGFVCDSFPAIVAFGANAALPHYNPLTGNNASLQSDADTLLLIDSGGQYEGGTTDITRTILIGRATDAMKSDFTAVLRGHIALATTVFPKGVFGSQLDTLVRTPLWEIGADFGHGTGHGVGFFLSVHEGPVSISPRAPVKESSRVVPGLVLSNEPGLYRAGQYGIRTENLVTPVVDETMLSAMQPMLRMQTLSLAPIETRLIKTAMMTPVEINWVNDYHNRVREELMPLLSPRARRWLERATEII